MEEQLDVMTIFADWTLEDLLYFVQYEHAEWTVKGYTNIHFQIKHDTLIMYGTPPK